MPAISVIMPVYNTGREKLNRSINSVLKQTLYDFELILIDDGSNDGSEKVCDYFSKREPRVITIHQKNQGLCSARNIGIKNANGEYIAFLDHDDEYNIELLFDNYRLVKKYNLDIVKFGYEYVVFDENAHMSIKGKRQRLKNIDTNICITKKNSFKCYQELMENKILTYIWDGLYKREFILNNKIFFNTQYTVGREDIAFNIECYKYVNRLMYNSKMYYKYYIYNTSTYKGMREEKYFDYMNDVITNFQDEKKLFQKCFKNNTNNYYEYRKMKQIMDVVGFFLERPKVPEMKKIKKYLLNFYLKFKVTKTDYQLGKGYLTIKQKIIINLFMHKNFDSIYILIKLYSKLKRL